MQAVRGRVSGPALKRGDKVRHIKCMSTGRPACANDTQDFICQMSRVLSQLLGLKGGTSPFFEYINLKCDLPPTE